MHFFQPLFFKQPLRVCELPFQHFQGLSFFFYADSGLTFEQFFERTEFFIGVTVESFSRQIQGFLQLFKCPVQILGLELVQLAAQFRFDSAGNFFFHCLQRLFQSSTDKFVEFAQAFQRAVFSVLPGFP